MTDTVTVIEVGVEEGVIGTARIAQALDHDLVTVDQEG